MIFATKIKMMEGKNDSNSVRDIDEIYLEGEEIKREGFYKKGEVYDLLRLKPYSMRAKSAPNPFLIPVYAPGVGKFVETNARKPEEDRLLKLPRE